MMKKIIVAFLFLIGAQLTTVAQKYAFIDVEYILKSMPEYTEAQEALDKVSKEWQKEVQEKYKIVEEKIQALKQEEILLPAEAKKKRQQEIAKLQSEAQQLQQKYFGVDGLLFQKRQELIEPVQNKIYKAVKKMSDDKGYDFVLDKGKNSNILYVDAKYDKSDYIIKLLKN